MISPKPEIHKAARTIFWLVLDAVLINAAMVFAQILRYSSHFLYGFFFNYIRLAPIMTVVCLLTYWAFGIYRTMWEYASARDIVRLGGATLAAAVLVYGASLLANLFVLPVNLFRLHRFVYVLFWPISLLFMGGSRLLYRSIALHGHLPLTDSETRRTMIVGAGWGGASIVHGMQRGGYGDRIPVVVVDDDKIRTGSRLSGVPVVRGSGNILKLASDYHIDDIIIAIATPHGDLAPLIEKCLATGCRVQRISPPQDISNDVSSIENVRDIDISDLLGRPEEKLDMTQVAMCFRDKTVLITGGGGSIGSELCRRLLPLQPARIVLYDISENYMYDLFSELQLKYPDGLNEKLILCVGSIRDSQRLNEIFCRYQPDIVLHAAAHKHVPLMEDCPAQAVKNNVFGTYLTAQAAIAHKVKRFVLISTDKAVNPTSVMGATKRLAEMTIEALNCGSDTDFTAVRFGNVLGSHGSVVPKFEQQIRAGGPVTLTHPDMIRYFMTIPEAASLVLQAASIAKGGDLFVLDMGQPVKIRELAEHMIRLYARPDAPKVELQYTGLRPGEKLYEELLLDSEGIAKTEKEKIFIAQPEVISIEALHGMLSQLHSCIDANGDMLTCLHQLVPTFKEPRDVNPQARQIRAAQLQAGA
ncbi:MAG: nucleoside-diphosphate sugar epimerase/dehydratase [Clostridia bacterium]